MISYEIFATVRTVPLAYARPLVVLSGLRIYVNIQGTGAVKNRFHVDEKKSTNGIITKILSCLVYTWDFHDLYYVYNIISIVASRNKGPWRVSETKRRRLLLLLQPLISTIIFFLYLTRMRNCYSSAQQHINKYFTVEKKFV